MKFLSRAEKDAHDAQNEVVAVQAAMVAAAQAGDMDAIVSLNSRLLEASLSLAEARSKPVLGECRRCGKEIELDDFRELVVCAIVDHRPGAVPQPEVFERGQELHLAYCRECEEGSRLMVYLTKR